MVDLQDALLANADRLLVSALTVLDLGHVALARSLAILGLEESGKAIAIHERRIEMAYVSEGEPFMCDQLEELWASHERKLELVHRFLVEERYWFGAEPSNPAANAASLGSIRAWARRHDRSKQRGFYVDVSRTGAVMAPNDVADEDALRSVIQFVHQIGWQLRLGEHIEGKQQDSQEAGTPPMSDEDLAWLDKVASDLPQDTRDTSIAILQGMRAGHPGTPLRNSAYRFNPPDADRNPFRNLGKQGYEAQDRQLDQLRDELDRQVGEGGEGSANADAGP
ncbi:AbiV family abortive infection protein [Jatrophihabitans sp.]|uniref:AbiV family abortive infection protein n=1 Tax=Jatrophihabitans sp. TaxID=1932789 RepID=UPI002BE754ED|nr:AbiV family abortive infection protein [Jatrophihabitans sp.]